MLTDRQRHKKDVHGICVKMLEARISVCRNAIDNAQQASNNEEKSSAGDKFETSRAMNHLEKEMYGKQLQSNLAEFAALQSRDPETLHTSVKAGAFIACKNFDIYIAAGLGKTKINDRIVYLISPEAPLNLLLKAKKEGDRFIFNQTQEEIIEIY